MNEIESISLRNTAIEGGIEALKDAIKSAPNLKVSLKDTIKSAPNLKVSLVKSMAYARY